MQRSEFLDSHEHTCFAPCGGIRSCKNFLMTTITSTYHVLLTKPNQYIDVKMFSEFLEHKFST